MIPVYKPHIGKEEKDYVMDCLDSTWISSKGKYVSLFEKEFSDYIGIKYGTSVCNGTIALHLALLALGIGKEDEVIVPTFTYIASVNAIKYVDATPIFVDSDEQTWQMDVHDIRKKISKKTKAIIAVHLYGQPCDMIEIMKIAKEFGLFVVEDCAEAIGSKIGDIKVGCFGDIACFSFFGNKTITTGEGGMVLTNDTTLYERANHLKGQGLVAHREYWHDIVGYNFRMTNICAAIGLGQLHHVDLTIQSKQDIFHFYYNKLKNLPLKFLEEKKGTFNTYWMCCIQVADMEEREKLREFLKVKEIETRPAFYPVHTMPMYSEKYEKHPIAEKIGWSAINLPSWPGVSEKELTYICNSITEFFLNN